MFSSRRLFYLKCSSCSELTRYISRLTSSVYIGVPSSGSEFCLCASSSLTTEKQRFPKPRPAERSKHANSLHLVASRSAELFDSCVWGSESHSSKTVGDIARHLFRLRRLCRAQSHMCLFNVSSSRCLLIESRVCMLSLAFGLHGWAF
jgi:hypothetical protein